MDDSDGGIPAATNCPTTLEMSYNLRLTNVNEGRCSEDEIQRNQVSDENKTLHTQSENQKAPSLCQKLAVVNWRNVFTILLVTVDYFLVCGSISLIGAFFPTKVSYKSD